MKKKVQLRRNLRQKQKMKRRRLSVRPDSAAARVSDGHMTAAVHCGSCPAPFVEGCTICGRWATAADTSSVNRPTAPTSLNKIKQIKVKE